MCVHGALRILGSKAKLRVTITAQSYINGFFIPIGMLMSLLYVFETGPAMLLGGFSTNTDNEVLAAGDEAVPNPFIQASILAFMLFNMWAIFLVTVWYARSHNLRVWKTAVGLFLGTIVGFAVIEFVFLPLWEQTKHVINSLLRFV